jgi:hypothetical protein
MDGERQFRRHIQGTSQGTRNIMRYWLATLCAVAFVARVEAQELKPIFNGKDLTGWKVPADNQWWKVENGNLVATFDPKLKGSMLYTEKEFKDVAIECEFKFSGDVDSGVMLRKAAPPAKGDLQVQIGTSRSLKVDMTASVYAHGKYPEPGRAKVEKLLKVGDWNKLRIEAKGNVFKIRLNGQQVVTYEDPAYPNAGPIGLQVHAGVKMTVEFRNIKAGEI